MEETLSDMLGRWKAGYQQLLDLSEDLLRNFDVYDRVRADELMARRQSIIDEFQRIDDRLAAYLAQGGGAADRRLIEEFRTFQETATRKVLELDAIVISLAKERLASLKGDISQLSKKKTAVSAYQKGGRCL